jgi:hypothetical protein
MTATTTPPAQNAPLRWRPASFSTRSTIIASRLLNGSRAILNAHSGPVSIPRDAIVSTSSPIGASAAACLSRTRRSAELQASTTPTVPPSSKHSCKNPSLHGKCPFRASSRGCLLVGVLLRSRLCGQRSCGQFVVRHSQEQHLSSPWVRITPPSMVIVRAFAVPIRPRRLTHRSS